MQTEIFFMAVQFSKVAQKCSYLQRASSTTTLYLPIKLDFLYIIRTIASHVQNVSAGFIIQWLMCAECNSVQVVQPIFDSDAVSDAELH